MAKARRTVRDRKELDDGSVEIDLNTPAPNQEPKRDEPVEYGKPAPEPNKTETVVDQRRAHIAPQEPDEPPIDDQRSALKQREKAAAARLESERQARLQAEQARVADQNRHALELGSTQLDSVSNALAARKAEAERAAHDYASARNTGDVNAETEALRRMQRAEADVSTLEQGAVELKRNLEYRQRQPQPQVQQGTVNIEQALSQMPQLMHEEREWLRRHPDAITDKDRVQILQGAFALSQKEGLERGSPEYFRFMENRLGYQPEVDPNDAEYEDEDMDEPEPAPLPRRQLATPERHRPAMTAPPSRNSPGVSSREPSERDTKVTLSIQQREAAKFSGISERDYAENLKKLIIRKRGGFYQEVG
jgi:hypothetical protein